MTVMVVRWVVRARGSVKERVAKMFNKAHDQITMGGKTISGKIITILLVISLSLMAWTPLSISSAFADSGDSSATAAEGANGGAKNAAADNTAAQQGAAGNTANANDVAGGNTASAPTGSEQVAPAAPEASGNAAADSLSSNGAGASGQGATSTDQATPSSSSATNDNNVNAGLLANMVAAAGPTAQSDPGLKVVKTSAGDMTGTDADGNPAYALGDVITYAINVANDGSQTITGIEVEDDLVDWFGDDVQTIASLAPGESREFTAQYTVTEADILVGGVVNIATATGKDSGGQEIDPVFCTKEDPIEKANPSLKVDKSSTGTMTGTGDDGKPAYAVGDTMTYTVKVTNDGNLTIVDIVLVDEKLGYTEDAPYEYRDEIAPGTTIVILTKDYTVTEEDVEAGSIVNEAIVIGMTEGGSTGSVSSKDEQPVEPKVEMYTIKYVLNGGSHNGSTKDIVETYKDGEVISIHAVPTRDGYVFDYWEGSKFQPGDKYTVIGDHIFTAQWKEATPTPTPTPTPNPTPTPTPYPTPAYAAVTNAAAGPDATQADAAAPTAQTNVKGIDVVPNNDTPLVEGIEDAGNPLSSGEGSWSLFNLIAAIVTAVLSIAMLASAAGRKRVGSLNIASIAAAIAGIVLFVVTQNFAQPMAAFDGWSIAFGVIAVANIVMMAVSRKDQAGGGDQHIATAA